MALDISAASFALKEYYKGSKLANTLFDKSPFLALLAKENHSELVQGKYLVKPVTISGPAVSATLASAQAEEVASGGIAWQITTADLISAPQVAIKAVEASKDPAGSFMKAMTMEIDNALMTTEDLLSTYVYGAGDAVLGQVSSSGWSSGTVTLSNPADIVNFRKNMALEVHDSAAATSKTSGSAIGYVIAINRSLGTFDVAASIGGVKATTLTNWANSLYLKLVGTNASGAVVSGLQAWLPSSAPTSALFFNVNRTADSLLYGAYVDGSSKSIEEAIIDGLRAADANGGRPSHCFMNPRNYADLIKALGSKVNFADLDVGGVGFRGVLIHGSSGDVTVLSDRKCQVNNAYLLDMSTWSLAGFGDVPHLVDDTNGNVVRVRDAAMNYEARVVAYCNLACTVPGWSARVLLPSAT